MKKIFLVILILISIDCISQTKQIRKLGGTREVDSSGIFSVRPTTLFHVVTDAVFDSLMTVTGQATFGGIQATEVVATTLTNLLGLTSLNSVDVADTTVLHAQIKLLTGTGTATAGSDGDTIQGQSIQATTVSLTTAGLATYTFTLNNSLIRSTSSLFITLNTASAGVPLIQSYTVSGERATIKIFNAAAVTALNATVTLNILILN